MKIFELNSQIGQLINQVDKKQSNTSNITFKQYEKGIVISDKSESTTKGLIFTFTPNFLQGTLIVIFRANNVKSGDYHNLCCITNDAGQRFQMYVNGFNNKIYSFSDNKLQTTDTFFNDNYYHIVVLTYDGSLKKIYVDNVEQPIGSVSTIGTATPNQIWIGDGPTTHGINGDIGNITIFDSVITQEQRNQEYIKFLNMSALAIPKRNFLGSGTDYALEDGDITFYDKPQYEKADGTAITPIDWKAVSGTFKIVTESSDDSLVFGQRHTYDQYYECVTGDTTNGSMAFQSKQAYGTWEFTVKNENPNTNAMIFISENATWYQYSPLTNNGYVFVVYLLKGYLYKITGTTKTLLFTTADYLFSQFLWFDVKITRSLTGEFSFYIRIKDLYPTNAATRQYALMPVNFGSNPVTDNTHTISNYTVLEQSVENKAKNFKYSKGIV